MATDQSLVSSLATPPLMSAKMRISPVSWIVSTETDPRAGGAFPLGTSHWYLHQLTKAPFILGRDIG